MHDTTTVHLRIKWLIAIQLIVSIAPLASFLLPNSNWMFPAMWALSALSIAQLMLLSLWAGMSGRDWIIRVAGALGGSAYVAFWQMLAQYLSPGIENELSFTNAFLVLFINCAALVLVLSGSILLMQRKGTYLVHVSKVVAPVAPPRTQYSMLHLLVLMSICSLVLSLVKVAQPAEQTATGFGTLALVGGYILILVVFLMNSVCAVWATLSPNSPWLRIAFAIGISSLLGIALSIASGSYSFSWWMFIAACLVPAVSTAIVIVSLLIVRSCGYRCIPKEAVTAAV